MGPKKGSERSRGGNHDVNKRNARYEKWRYNGDFHQLPTFNQRVESEVMAKSRLAGCILKGYISVVRRENDVRVDVSTHRRSYDQYYVGTINNN